MKKEVKIYKPFLYTIYKGWMYMLEDNYFLPGDLVTDGEKNYKIREDCEVFLYAPHRYPVPFQEPDPMYHVYAFEEAIPDCEGKVLYKVEE